MKLTFTKTFTSRHERKVARTTQYMYVCMSCGNKTTIMARTCTKCGGGTVKMPRKPKSFWSKLISLLK